jgi:hypothetical protein
VVASSTTITATSPAGTAGAETVTVTVSGQSGSLTSAFIYVTAADASGYMLPLKSSANNRYLIDQNGTPFLIMGDSPQSMVGNLSSAIWLPTLQISGLPAAG